MNSELRYRVAALVGLAVLGAGLGLSGTALGMGGPVAENDSVVGFTVSDNDVTVSEGERNVTVVENMTSMKSVEIAENDGRYAVRAEETDPLTARERERAAAIARDNATVRRYLDRMGAYELSVEPIEVFETTSTADIEVTGNATGVNVSGDARAVEFEVVNDSLAADEESVTVSKDPTYLEDRVSVDATRPGETDSRYRFEVDLANGTVVAVTDWESNGHTDAQDRQ